jgi:hypothetical protein
METHGADGRDVVGFRRWHDARIFGRQQEGAAVRFEGVIELAGLDDDPCPDARLGPVIAEQPAGHRFFGERQRVIGIISYVDIVKALLDLAGSREEKRNPW